MASKSKEQFLEDYYYNTSNPGAYSGPDKLYNVLKKQKQYTFSKYFIKQWLQKQNAYSLQKQVRHSFRTARVVVSSINEMWDADLMDVQNIANYNNGVRYLLMCIDIFSRFLHVAPLQNKTAKTLLKAMKSIFEEGGVKPEKLRTDKGSEFNNRFLKKYLKDHDVYYFTTQNKPKANYVERVQKTFRNMMYRYFNRYRTYKYIDVLQNLVDNYNASPHKSLNYTAPKNVSQQNEADLWAYMYLRMPTKKTENSNKKKKVKRKKYKHFRFKVGDYVRLSYLKEPFRRSYQQQWSSEVFKISKRIWKDTIPMFKVVDLMNDPIKGNWYQSELQKIKIKENGLWLVDKLIRKRRRNNKTQWLVSFSGFPKKFNQWIDESNINEIKTL